MSTKKNATVIVNTPIPTSEVLKDKVFDKALKGATAFDKIVRNEFSAFVLKKVQENDDKDFFLAIQNNNVLEDANAVNSAKHRLEQDTASLKVAIGYIPTK